MKYQKAKFGFNDIEIDMLIDHATQTICFDIFITISVMSLRINS